MKPFQVGIVGYGWAAGAHIPAINAGPLAQVTAVCSSRTLDAAQISSEHGAPIQAFNDLDAMLAQPQLNTVSICSYHHQHKEQVLAAARAGKHIIVEKPLALSWPDVIEIERAVRAAGVDFCICFELRFSSQFRTIKALLDQGEIGRLHYGEIDYFHGIGPWYREFEWCTTNEGCGSSLLEAGIHALDALLLCLGDDVAEVFSYGAKSANSTFAAYEYPSTTVTLLKYQDGRVGKVASVIDCWQPYVFPVRLVGSEGSVFDNHFHSNRLHGDDRQRWKDLPFQPVDSGDVSDHPYQAQFEAFFEALARDESMPLTGLDQAVRTHKVLFAADRSWKENRPVKINEMRAG